jgi:hypothetical protein
MGPRAYNSAVARPDRDDLAAALEARRELGEELEPEVIDAFLDRIEKRAAARGRERVPAHAPSARRPDWSAFALAICSLGLAVPIVEKASFAGEVVMWLAIVAVNLAYNLRR